MTYKNGDVIQREGWIGSHFYIVTKGTVTLTRCPPLPLSGSFPSLLVMHLSDNSDFDKISKKDSSVNRIVGIGEYFGERALLDDEEANNLLQFFRNRSPMSFFLCSTFSFSWLVFSMFRRKFFFQLHFLKNTCVFEWQVAFNATASSDEVECHTIDRPSFEKLLGAAALLYLTNFLPEIPPRIGGGCVFDIISDGKVVIVFFGTRWLVPVWVPGVTCSLYSCRAVARPARPLRGCPTARICRLAQETLREAGLSFRPTTKP